MRRNRRSFWRQIFREIWRNISSLFCEKEPGSVAGFQPYFFPKFGKDFGAKIGRPPEVSGPDFPSLFLAFLFRLSRPKFLLKMAQSERMFFTRIFEPGETSEP